MSVLFSIYQILFKKLNTFISVSAGIINKRIKCRIVNWMGKASSLLLLLSK
jgi:hypothetical protein